MIPNFGIHIPDFRIKIVVFGIKIPNFDIKIIDSAIKISNFGIEIPKSVQKNNLYLKLFTDINCYNFLHKFGPFAPISTINYPRLIDQSQHHPDIPLNLFFTCMTRLQKFTDNRTSIPVSLIDVDKISYQHVIQVTTEKQKINYAL